MRRIYLDYAASTPVAESVMAAIQPYFSEKFGNSGSIHSFGQEAEKAISVSREIVAKELNSSPREVIFTGSATEANNTVIKGIIERTQIEKPRIIISAVEHESVSETAESLTSNGAEVITVPVSSDGMVEPARVKEILNDRTVLVSIIYASNIIGSIQPIKEIAGVINKFRKESQNIYPAFHVDGVQAFPFMKLDVQELGVDALTISGQKIYGPKGTGALYIKEDWRSRVGPLIIGGMHESGFRAGTVNTPAVVGIAKAVEYVSERRSKEEKRIGKLRDEFWESIKKKVPEAEVNGPLTNRLPNNLNIYFPGRNAQELLIALDQKGLAVSTGSACSVRAAKPSSAVLALGLGEERAGQSIRITLGYPTSEEEIKKAAEIIVNTVK